jgi:hypothetical protein
MSFGMESLNKADPQMEPKHWAIIYVLPLKIDIFLTATIPIVTAGLRWPPLMLAVAYTYE